MPTASGNVSFEGEEQTRRKRAAMTVEVAPNDERVAKFVIAMLIFPRDRATSRNPLKHYGRWSRRLEIDADGDVAARQLGNGTCVCHQLRKCRVLRQSLLHLAIHFPTGVARGN
jgi:hypothetical protein